MTYCEKILASRSSVDRKTAKKLEYAVDFTVGKEEPLLRFFSGLPVEKAWCSGLSVIVEKLISFSD